jgi:MtN3 and saliva related transmembrane protein
MGEFFGYMAAILTTASFIPQAVLTIRTQKTSEISFWMYLLFSLGVVCWLAYAVYLQHPGVIIANIITLALAGTILVIKVRNMLRGNP